MASPHSWAQLAAPFPAAATCADDATICNAVLASTGNTRLAVLAHWLIGAPLAILGLICIGFAARWLLHRLVNQLVERAESGVLPARRGTPNGSSSDPESTHFPRRIQRARAVGSLLRSIATMVVVTVVVMMIISELGYSIGPLVASAGILGVAIGFGAQSLVKDFLSGIFMIFEDQYGVGDEVDFGEAIGTVEQVNLRVTRLRDLNGTVWYVRNGEILRVGNMSQNWARTVLDVSVAYGEDLTRVMQVLADVAHDLWDDEDFKDIVLEEPSVWGVQDLAPDGVTIRVALKTAPSQQWAVAREMRSRIKIRFDHEGIEIPFPQVAIWRREQSAASAERMDVDE